MEKRGRSELLQSFSLKTGDMRELGTVGGITWWSAEVQVALTFTDILELFLSLSYTTDAIFDINFITKLMNKIKRLSWEEVGFFWKVEINQIR